MSDKVTTVSTFDGSVISANHGINDIACNENRNLVYVNKLRTPSLLVVDGEIGVIKAICLNLFLEYGIIFNATGKYSLDLYPVLNWTMYGVRGLKAKVGALSIGISCLITFLNI